MKYTFTIAALAAFVAAQSIADLPSCSLSCMITAASSIGCSATDLKCACSKADKLTPAVAPCVLKACPSSAEQEKVMTVISGLCAAAGVPISIPEPVESSAAAPASTHESPKPSAPAASSAAPKPSVPVASYAASKPSAPAEASTSVAPTIQTSVPATPSMTEIVISSSGYAFPSATKESSCVIVTVTVTQTSSSAAVPYPTGHVGTGVPISPSGTGAYSASPPYFTGAAAGMKVPAVAGLLGLAALVL